MDKIQRLYEIFTAYPRITIDSRRCPDNSIFFALKGENTDGNLFAAKALENGAKCAVVDDAEIAKQDERFFLVDDVLTAMQELARIHRKSLKTKILAITGTNGKTTTKELVSAVLSKKYRVLYTEKNYNNHIGVPLTILRMTENDDFGVIEIGANHKGEIAHLSSIVEPDFGLITNFGKAHLEGFGSIEGVIEAKTELFQQLQKTGGRAFINIGDSVMVERSQELVGTISYAVNNDRADVSGYISEENPMITLLWSSSRFSVPANRTKTHLIGKYNVENLLAAVIVGLFFEVESKEVSEALSEYIPENHRSQYLKTENNELIIDTYNANPSSMEASLRNFAGLNFPHKTLIIGDMLEMGETSLAEHKSILKLADSLCFDRIILVGSIFSSISSVHEKFPTAQALVEYLQASPIKGSAILLKSSNGIGLSSIVDFLR